MKNNLLLIGAGAMGRAIAYDLRNQEPKHPIVVIDCDPAALNSLLEFVGGDGVTVVQGDISDSSLISAHMQDAIVTIGAASYRYNLEHSKLAIAAGSSWVDLGGNNDVVNSQFALNANAVRTGVTIVPDCGLAPGIVNVLTGDVLRRLDSIKELHYRVGGLPLNPQPPLFYGLVFSPEGLANEYYEPALVIENGEVQTVESLTGWERLNAGPPYGALEAFHTSGGSSTMIVSMRGRVEQLDYKTIRYPGHLKKVKLLKDLGYFDPETIDLGNSSQVSPRKLTSHLLEKLGWVTDDVVIVKCWAIGESQSRETRIDYSIIDEVDEKTGLTAMARTTGFSASIIARMIAEGVIRDKGVIRQDKSVPPSAFIAELGKRSIDVKIEIKDML